MKPEIYLIGTNHYDPNGPARLERLLNHLQPGYVSVETDKLRAREAEQKEEILQDPKGLDAFEKTILSVFPMANPKTIRKTIKVNYFEYLVARDYCQQNGIPTSLPLILADSAKEAAKISYNGETYEEEAANLSKTPSEFAQMVEQWYRERPMQVQVDDVKRFNFVARDVYIETKLRRLAQKVALGSKIKELFGQKQKKPDRIVHVGGASHLFGSYPNLFERLSDLHPTRIKLNEADKL
ncbi:MAG: hypothetical protein AABW48_05195 [Nanoarchaeota archaeon]